MLGALLHDVVGGPAGLLESRLQTQIVEVGRKEARVEVRSDAIGLIRFTVRLQQHGHCFWLSVRDNREAMMRLSIVLLEGSLLGGNTFGCLIRGGLPWSSCLFLFG